MKLRELMEAMSKGTYAGVYFDEDTKAAVKQYIEYNNIPKPVNVDKLHTTLLFSRKYLPDYEPDGIYNNPLVGTPTELVVWETQRDEDKEPTNCLVLKYDCAKLVDRHKSLMKEHEATFDYPEFTPHITLSYDIGDMEIGDMSDITDVIKHIIIVEEYSEDLKLDWAHEAHK